MTSIASPVSRPSLVLLGAEPWRAAFEYAKLKLSAPAPRVRGDGHPVVIFPGLASDGRAVAPLRRFCKSQGYNAMDWGRGFNRGPEGNLDEWMQRLAADVETILGPYDQKATLIGWSLGGFYAREIGKLLAPRLRQVITIGTPFNSTEDSSNVGWIFKLLNGQPPRFDPVLSERFRTAPPLPTTSIYSKSDGIVAWQTCRHDATCERVQDIEVAGSHIGMGWNPAVFKVLADKLRASSDIPA